MSDSKNHFLLLLSFSLCFLSCKLNNCNAIDQTTNLYKLLKSKSSKNPSLRASWTNFPAQLGDSQVHVQSQDGLMESDKLSSLPGQPAGVDFNQYSGYVTIDPGAGKALFYYFVESPQNSSSKPLVLWLNGGPGCSSFGNGGLLELGPFRVNSNGKTLFRNKYSWNNVANVIFLESPAGVGFSYAKETSAYEQTGDISTAKDTYTFIVNWLERFPQYKKRELYLTGESYAGHYIPQLAYTILQNNKNKHINRNVINLKGIAIGNAWMDDATSLAGMYDYLWSHAMYSDEAHAKVQKFCDFSKENISEECGDAADQAAQEIGSIDVYNIYAPTCLKSGQETAYILDSIELYDPCSSYYVDKYLNNGEVQRALHAKPTKWESCRGFDWKDSPSTVLPIIQKLMASNISVCIYSGDVDGRVPVTSSKYSINTLKLPIKTPWRPWYSENQIGGYVVEYEGLVFVTVRGAGHLVPTYQPKRALTMISSFLRGTLPPKQ